MPSCTLWGGQLYGTTALIWRGGLAVAYLHHGYTSGHYSTSHDLRVEWIEPGVPDQERVARKLAREEAAAAERLRVDVVAHDDADDAHATGREARRLQGATRGRARRWQARAARYFRIAARAA